MKPFALAMLLMAAAAMPAFSDRLTAINARIAANAQQHLLAPGQQALLTAQLDAAQKADGAHDPNAPAMLDVIDRQLALVDHTLARPENGTVLIVRTGDDVTVAMRDGVDYEMEMTPVGALMRHIGVMYMRGVQGGFVAQKPAIVTITLTPVAPNPRAAQPARFTVVILPR